MSVAPLFPSSAPTAGLFPRESRESRDARTPKVLVIDNYDSFTFNLVHAIGRVTGREPLVFRNDAVTLSAIRQMAPTHVVLSPGPGRPERERDVGVCLPLLCDPPDAVGILGVCLGHQSLAFAFGGRIVRAPRAMHGKVSRVHHAGGRLFAGVSPELDAMRYHSLVVDPGTVPKELRVVASTPDGVVMALEHKAKALFGVQFHPESIATPLGHRIIRNFLGVGGP